MRYRKMICCVLVLLLGIFVGQACASNSYAKVSRKKQHQLYQEVIRKYDKHMKKLCAAAGGDYEKMHTFYAYADIDKNGVAECILRFVSDSKCNTADVYSYGETTAIYTIAKGKVKPVIKMKNYYNPYMHDNYCVIYKRSNSIDRGFSHGYEDRMFYTYKNGRLSKKGVSYTCVKNSGEKAHYSINGKEVEKSVYKRRLKSLIGNKKGYEMKRL